MSKKTFSRMIWNGRICYTGKRSPCVGPASIIDVCLGPIERQPLDQNIHEDPNCILQKGILNGGSRASFCWIFVLWGVRCWLGFGSGCRAGGEMSVVSVLLGGQNRCELIGWRRSWLGRGTMHWVWQRYVAEPTCRSIRPDRVVFPAHGGGADKRSS